MDYKEEQKKTRDALKPKRNEELSKPRSMRKMVRQKVVDRRFTKKGYSYGLKIDGRDYNLVHSIAKRQEEKDA